MKSRKSSITEGQLSTNSSVLPGGFVKCRCHMYHALPWNGSCTVCGIRHTCVPNYIGVMTGDDNNPSTEYKSDSDYQDFPSSSEDDDDGYADRGRDPKKLRTITAKFRMKRLKPKEYTDAQTNYKLACRHRQADPVGHVRSHHDYEKAYFDIARKTCYEGIPLMKRDGDDLWKFPKLNWVSNIKRKKLYPPIDLVRSLISFSSNNYQHSLRHGWEDKLMELPLCSPTRFCYSLLMAVTAQGMADAVVVPHINSLIEIYGNKMVLAWLEDSEFVSTLIRRTSKWVKNSVLISKLAIYIKENLEGCPPTQFEFYTGIKYINQKTAALLFWGWRQETVCVPVDLHVAYSFKRFGWCHMKASREEIAFQAKEWLPCELSIKLNDALGAIGQQLTGRRSREKCESTLAVDAFHKMMDTAEQWDDPCVLELLSKL